MRKIVKKKFDNKKNKNCGKKIKIEKINKYYSQLRKMPKKEKWNK